MKKFLILIGALLLCNCAYAQTIYSVSGVTMQNYWQKKDIDEEKILTVGQKILLANKIAKRIPIVMDNTPNVINAFSNPYYKTVHISSGILPYIDNDDELAAIISHEIAHSFEAYGGMHKLMSITANSKKYEMKADLNGIDYMVKAGYNPIAMIIINNKISQEPLWDWGFTSSHPKGSKRVIAMYKYIYVKYPQYLNSEMTSNPNYQIFLNAMTDEINGFHQKQKNKKYNQNTEL